MAEQNPGAETALRLSQKLRELIAYGSLDYNSWKSLILEVENTCQDDIDTISLSYDSFLEKFPLCHWHLERYAYCKAKLCGTQEAIKVYERGSGLAMFSVGFWVDYFAFGTACFGDPEDIRKLFGRAVSFVGKDYFCHALWDKYMKYEFNQQGWNFLAQSYIQALRFPTKKLYFYYDNFKQFVANLEEEMEYEKNDHIEVEKLSGPYAAIKMSGDEISLVVKDLLGSSDKVLKCKALYRYRSIGEEFYQESCNLNEKIKCFETNIKRRFFCVTPLDDHQLNNWHLYLDFVEKQENLDWTVKLYERCLISCASYPEFWMRYVNFLESSGGRELAISALDRATKIFLKNVPDIHLFSARFKEHLGDVNGACASLQQCDAKTDSIFFEKVVTEANIERRLGNLIKASTTYEEALKTAKEKQKIHILPRLYSHYSRFTFMITGSADAARNILINGVKEVPNCRFLFEELMNFAMTHEGSNQVNVIDSIISGAVSPGSDEYHGLNAKDRETISLLFLEFMNLCGSVHDVMKAWNRHISLFPQFLRSEPYKHFASGSFLLNMVQLQVEQGPVNGEIDHTQVMEKLSPQKDNNCKETAEPVYTKAIVPSDKDMSQGNEPIDGLSRQSREDKPGPVDVSAKLAESNGNVLISHDSVHDFSCQSKVEKPGLMVVSAETIDQSAKQALTKCEPANEFGKLTETTDPVDQLSLLDHEFKHQNLPVPLESTTILNYREKENQESIPMSCDVYKAEVVVSPTSSPIIESPLFHNASEKDGSVSQQNSTITNMPADSKEPSKTGVTLIEKVTAPGYTSSGFHERAKDQEQNNHPGNESDSKMLMKQGNIESNSGIQICGQSAGVIQETTKTDHAGPVCTTVPPSDASAAQSPLLSSPLVSYPQQNVQQNNLPSTQDPWQAQQNMAMDQMLQYHYHQQHLGQQHYQQHMQQPLFQLQHQYMNQQQYQQLNQQHLQLLPQQYYGQDQHQITYCEQFHQQLQQHHYYQQNQQLQQGQDPRQLQEFAYDMNQQGYQQHVATQGQQIPLLQYQQHQQTYQHFHQQQPHGGHPHGPEHLRQQDEQFHKQQELSSGQTMSKKQEVPINAPPNHDGASESCKSPHI
ncbi:uncharacterized protein [Primulina huaijiensis]|uniref:uncharacterized protein isoform X2 n=1 Tax=Primulina huaijiensis TaxID=1492673 RepID=UPI003CC790EE